MYRYIDDLLSTDNRFILDDIDSNYLHTLEIDDTNSAPHANYSFLDIDIEITDEVFGHKVYDRKGITILKY